MPWHAPSSRRSRDRAYGEKRRELHGKDPRGTARWQKLRKMVLARNPLCADPFKAHAVIGRVEAATEVDHVIPLWERIDLAFDATNLSPLCKRCHSRKSGMERRASNSAAKT